MKLAILSDSHDNIPNLEKTLKFINQEGIKTIIHCGDLCAPSILTEVIVPNFDGEVHLVHDNVGDPEVLEKVAKGYKNITIHGYKGEITIPTPAVCHSRVESEAFRHRESIKLDSCLRRNNIKIAFTHFPDKGKKLAESGKYDLVFYGHTHKPWEESIKNATRYKPALSKFEGLHVTRLVNPGTLAGMFYKATFAIYDTNRDKLELKILEKL